jgi:hypothetical protein
LQSYKVEVGISDSVRVGLGTIDEGYGYVASGPRASTNSGSEGLVVVDASGVLLGSEFDVLDDVLVVGLESVYKGLGVELVD